MGYFLLIDPGSEKFVSVFIIYALRTYVKRGSKNRIRTKFAVFWSKKCKTFYLNADLCIAFYANL